MYMGHICLGKNVNKKYLKMKCPGTHFDLGMMKQASKQLGTYVTTT
jgi:hypothetical protein